MNDQPCAVRYIRTNATGYAQAADIARQKDVCEKVAAEHGLTITDTYEDILNPATPALTQLISDAEAGKVDIVVCSSIDRLVRNAEKLGYVLGRLDVVALDADTRQPLDQGSAEVVSLISRLATDDRGERVRRGIRRGRETR